MTRTLLEAFNETVKASKEIDPRVDAGIIETGRKLAEAIDLAERGTMADWVKALGLVPHLNAVTRELLASPLARRQANMRTPAGEGGTLGRLRAINGKSA